MTTTLQLQDNFLNEQEFTQIKESLFPENNKLKLPWTFGPINTNLKNGIVAAPKYNYYISHIFYDYHNGWNTITSEHFECMRPLLVNLKPKVIMRIKANVYFWKDKPIEHGYHTDFPFDSTTAIFYVNTNNGYTKFEDGTIVESVANRVVTFPTPIRHTSVSQTDTGYRITINCNYM